MTETTVRADPAHRRKVALLVLLILAVGALSISALANRLAEIGELATESPDLATEQFLATARWVLAVPAVGLALSGLLMARLGWRGWRESRYPPTGARLLADQPLVAGAEARKRSALVCAFAIAALIGSALLPFFVHQRLAMVLDSAKARAEHAIE